MRQDLKVLAAPTSPKEAGGSRKTHAAPLGDQAIIPLLWGESQVLVGDSTSGSSQPSLAVDAATIGSGSVGRTRPVWKALLDVVGALAGLLVLLPVFVAIAALIKCASRGPVFFWHKRYGFRGQTFHVMKFRTIETATATSTHSDHVCRLIEMDEPMQKIDHELKMIPGGKWLRQLGLDELPQLVNVLLGQMSLVGPRPDVIPYDRYEPWQQKRFEVLPGITGLWQVNGKNRTTFATMMQLDVDYVEHQSLWLDVVILLKTIPSVLRESLKTA